MDLRVPTLHLEAELNYAGETLAGTVFLPTHAHHHSGAQRPDEWINQNTGFFPFLRRGQERTVILNKDKVLLMHVPLTGEVQTPFDEQPYTCRVEIDCDDRTLQGTLVIELPEGQNRVLDAVNQPQSFLPLWSPDSLYLIRKSFIRKISEVDRA